MGRRFAVTPLAEDCGLVEWVNGLSTLRHTVQVGFRVPINPSRTAQTVLCVEPPVSPVLCVQLSR